VHLAILSTCNRTEIYCAAESPDVVIDWLVPLATECKPYLIDTALFAELVEKYGENFPTYLRYKDMYMIFVKNTMVTVYSVIKPDPKDDNSNENHRKLRTKRHTAKS
jgi:hypothetical protein